MDLTKGNIRKNIITFALPIIIMNIINQLYSIVDSVIIARFASERSLAVMSSTISILLIGYCLINGASSAIHILIGNKFGEKNYEEIHNIMKTTYNVGFIFSLLLVIIYVLFGKHIFQFINLPLELLNDCLILLYIYAFSFIIQMFVNMQSSILSGIGDSKNPMMISITTQIINIILDIIVVAVFKWDVFGAAIASTFALIISMIWTQFIINKTLLKHTSTRGKYKTIIFKEYLKLAIPSMLQQSIMSIGGLFIQYLINNNGIEAINGYTVATNINSLLIIPIVSFTIAFETFAAQNIGANQHSQVKEGYTFTIQYGWILCIFLSITTFLLSKLCISLYLDIDSASFIFANHFLLLLIPNYFCLLYKQTIDGLFKANMKVYLFTISSFISLFFRIMFSFIFANHFGLISLAYATTLGTLIAVLFDFVMKWIYKY